MTPADPYDDVPAPRGPHRREYDGPEGIDVLPGMARVALGAWWRTAGWAVRTSLRMPRLVAEAALSPDRALELVKGVLGAIPQNLSGAGPPDDAHERPPTNGRLRGESAEQLERSLRDEGEQLLRRSRDVRHEVPAHPAYERILSELAPDEGRILRLLLLSGPQASIDIRTGGPVAIARSRLIAPGLSMIGARAGCRYVDRVPSYLNNLFRLGMVWFSRETLRDPQRYQVLEAQPDVLEAIHSVRYAKVVRRSIHLTPFGEDFCRVCLAPEDHAPDDFPEHSTPAAAADAPAPPTELTGEP